MRQWLAIVCLLCSIGASAETAFISIIVDDIGYNRERGERAIALPAPLTFSILPFTEHGAELAGRATEAGREVMIHMPMANVSGKEIGPGGLTPELSHANFVDRVSNALASVPNARGMNNHMGSLLTTRPLEMRWLMAEVKRHGLFFIDSRTTRETVASIIAREQKIASASRDVFLDNDPTPAAIDAEFRRLIARAKAQGIAIAIGHPHDATIEYLEQALPRLAAEGIQVVPVSHAIALHQLLAHRSSPQIATD